MLSVFAVLRTYVSRLRVISLRNKFILVDSLILLEFFQQVFLFARCNRFFLPPPPFPTNRISQPARDASNESCLNIYVANMLKDSSRYNSVDSFRT